MYPPPSANMYPPPAAQSPGATLGYSAMQHPVQPQQQHQPVSVSTFTLSIWHTAVLWHSILGVWSHMHTAHTCYKLTRNAPHLACKNGCWVLFLLLPYKTFSIHTCLTTQCNVLQLSITSYNAHSVRNLQYFFQAHQTPSPSTSSTASGVRLDAMDFTKAQKYCKYAVSALQYEDVPTAVENLEKALNLLQTGEGWDMTKQCVKNYRICKFIFRFAIY